MFGALVIFSLVEMSIAAWITAKYNANRNFPNLGASALPTLHVDLDDHVWVGVFSGISRSHKQHLHRRSIAFLFVCSISFYLTF